MARAFRIIFRWLLWLLLAWVVVRGVVSFLPQPAPVNAGPPAPVQVEATSDPARTFALLFAQEYLTWRSNDTADHAARIKPYLAGNVEEQAGWRGSSSARDQTALGAWVYADQRLSNTRRLITVAVRARGGTEGPMRVLYLAVPVSQTARGLAVDDLPAIAPGPVHADPTGALWGEQITTVPPEVGTLAEGFLRAYVNGSEAEMTYFMSPGVQIPSLRGTMAWSSLDDLKLYKDKDGTVAVVQGTIRDPISGASLRQTWALRLEQRERWYVKDLLQKGATNP